MVSESADFSLDPPDTQGVLHSPPRAWGFLCACARRATPTRPCGCPLPVAAAGAPPIRWVDRAPLPALASLVAYHAFRRTRPAFPCTAPPAFEDPGLVDVFWGAGLPSLAEPSAAVAALLAVARAGGARGAVLPAVGACDALALGLGAAAGGGPPYIGYLRADAQLALLAACRAAGGELRDLLAGCGGGGPAGSNATALCGAAVDALDAAVRGAAAFVDACHAMGGVPLAGTTPLLRAAMACCSGGGGGGSGGGATMPALPLVEPDAACDLGWLAPVAPPRPLPAGGSVWAAFPPAELAAAWAVLDWDAFRCVPLHELHADHSGAATEECYHHGADMFLRFTRQRANAVSLWVYAELAGCRGDVAAAAQLLERMLAVGAHLRALHDYTGAFALGAGLDVIIPAKLGAARARLSAAGAAEFAALAALVNSRSEHEAYRAAWAKRPRGAPVVPYLGAHNKEAMTLKEKAATDGNNVLLARTQLVFWAQLLAAQEVGFEERGAVPPGTASGAAAAALRAASRPCDIADEAERKAVELQLDAWAAPLRLAA